MRSAANIQLKVICIPIFEMSHLHDVYQNGTPTNEEQLTKINRCVHSTKQATKSFRLSASVLRYGVPDGSPYRRNLTRLYRSRIAANRRANRPCKTVLNRRRTSYQISFAPPYRDCIYLGSGPEVAKCVSYTIRTALIQFGTINEI